MSFEAYTFQTTLSIKDLDPRKRSSEPLVGGKMGRVKFSLSSRGRSLIETVS